MIFIPATLHFPQLPLPSLFLLILPLSGQLSHLRESSPELTKEVSSPFILAQYHISYVKVEILHLLL